MVFFEQHNLQLSVSPKGTTNPKLAERKSMNNKFDELTKKLGQCVTRRAVPKKFGLGLACVGLAGLLATSGISENLEPNSSTIFDASGDALFPYDLYGAPVPPYLDIVRASVSASRE